MPATASAPATAPSAAPPLSPRAFARFMREQREAFVAELEAEFGPLPARQEPPPRPARLLLLGCSATKSAAEGRLPIRERYRGPLWLTLGATDPAGELAQVVALSAEYGFLPEWHEIPAYEARLSAVAGARLAAEIAAGCPGHHAERGNAAGRAHRSLARLAATAARELADAARRAGRPLEEIALCGGAAYLAPMRAAIALGRERGWIAPDALVEEINDQIGLMRRGLRQWLEAGRQAAGEDTAPAVASNAPEPVAPAPAPAETPIAASPVAAPATGLGHNGGPPLELEAPTKPAPASRHLAELHQAAAAAAAKIAEAEASAEREAARLARAWRDALPDASRRFAPSRLEKCPRDRNALADAQHQAREAAGAKRAGQVAGLRAKLARIRQAIAAAEARQAGRRGNTGPPVASAAITATREASRPRLDRGISR